MAADFASPAAEVMQIFCFEDFSLHIRLTSTLGVLLVRRLQSFASPVRRLRLAGHKEVQSYDGALGTSSNILRKTFSLRNSPII